MTKLNDNLVSANFALYGFTVNPINANATGAEYGVDLTDCKEEVLLLVDASSASSDLTMKISGGDYAGRMADATYTVPGGSCKYLSISSGETMQRDGMMHLTFSASTNLSTLGATVAVFKKRFVTNH